MGKIRHSLKGSICEKYRTLLLNCTCMAFVTIMNLHKACYTTVFHPKRMMMLLSPTDNYSLAQGYHEAIKDMAATATYV